MSELPDLNDAGPGQSPTMPGQIGWYTVMKPGKILNAAGQSQMEPVGMYPSLADANDVSLKFPGSWIMLNVLIYVQPIIPAKLS